MSPLQKLLISLLILFCLTPIVSAEPTEETAIAAWEGQLRDDPRTLAFEKIGEREYHYKTSWFPYEGSLRIVHVVIDEAAYLDAQQATFDIELIDADDDFLARYQNSYSQWDTHYTRFYYHPDEERWVSAGDYFELFQTDDGNLLDFWNTYDWLIVELVIFVPALIIIIRQLSQTNKTLKEIRDRLNRPDA